METLSIFDIEAIIKTLGLLGIFLIVFAESGLLIGMFFPGDSLLFTAGLLASFGVISIWALIPVVILAAILGDSTGYWFGDKLGPKIFNREDSLLFSKKHIERAHLFYEKYGAKAIILARFVPVVRTLVPTIAGIGAMEYRKFLRFNIIGGALWSTSLPLLGFFLGKTVPDIDKYLLPIILGIIIFSFVPIVLEVWKGRRGKGGK